jgi:DNA-binding CsgD family transcriptional regulator
MTKAPASLSVLTDKQRQVLALVADNRTSKEIAGLLGVSESAVNQRIEMVRARLGGLPRGELARLYRQEFTPEDSEQEKLTWQKILLPPGTAIGQGGVTEGIPSPAFGGSHTGQLGDGDGSQLSAFLLGSTPAWLSRENRAMALARFGAMAGIVVVGMVIAALITQMLSSGHG